MSSPEQNRINASSSTGPRTPEGKAASSQNARKHGLSSQFLPLSEEERPAFEELEASLREHIHPQGPLQEIAFRQLVSAAWKREVVDSLILETAQSTRELFAEELSERVRKLERHKHDQERAYNRALRQLREMQTIDRVREVTFDALIQTGVDPSDMEGLADYAKVTKQSHQYKDVYLSQQEYMEEEAKIVEAQIAEIAKHFPMYPPRERN